MEKWENVKGYEGLYLVSNSGKIKRVARIVHRDKMGILNYKEKEISQNIDKYGYSCVSLQKDGKRKTMLIHRIVMEAFSKEPKKPTVNHKDCNKQNNYDWNLEWATIKENIDHAMKNGLRGFCGKSVEKLKDGLFIEKYESVKIAAEKNNVSRAAIIQYCKGKRNSKSGFIYKYSN